MALATPDDVVYPLLRPLTEAEENYAVRLLDWAETLIKARYPDIATLAPTNVIMVEAQAVARVIRNPEGMYQEAVGGGEFSGTRDKAGADGVLRILDEEWELLAPTPVKTGKAFSIDTAPVGTLNHSVVCTLLMGGTYCSCGATLTQGQTPIYETD